MPNGPTQVGHRAEFEELLGTVAPVAYKVAVRLARNPDDAMDLLQDATVQAYKGFETFQRGSNFRAWFLRVLTNRFLKSKSRRVLETVPIDDAEDIYLYRKSQELGEEGNSPDPAGLLIDRLDVEAVQNALERLADEFRTGAGV